MPFIRALEQGEFKINDESGDIREISQKLRLKNTKKELQTQIFGLRMKHNAMLKSEFDTKINALKEKWSQIENCSIEEMPDKEDIEQMVGLVNNKVKIKTLHEMIKEKTKEDYQIEESQAKEFIRQMKQSKLDRKKFQELD